LNTVVNRKMKHILFILFLLQLAQPSSSKSREFDRQVNELKKYLEAYDNLPRYMDEYTALKNLPVTKQEIKDAIKYGYYERPFNKKKDSVVAWIPMEILQENIIDGIKAMISARDFRKYDLPSLFRNTALNILRSEDSMLYIFSFQEKGAGSYDTRIALFHYTGLDPDLASYRSLEGGYLEGKQYGVFIAQGYDTIYTFKEAKWTKYLLFGLVRPCSSCLPAYMINLVHFQDSVFVSDFSYGVETRNSNNEMSYDAETKTITAIHEGSMGSRVCGCRDNNLPDPPETEEEDTEGPEKRCECVFRYDGNSFRLVKSCWSIISEDEGQ
jgi:hypothetical protein